MADNVTITSGANSTPPDGTIVATDDIGGVHYPYTKLVFGADGTATLVTASNPLPIEPGTSVTFTVVNAGTFAVQVDAALPSGDNNIGNVDIVDDVVSGFDHGAKSSISTSAVQITASSIAAQRGVLVKAANDNSGTVYVGNSDVTNGSADATDGFELGAGESVLVKVNNANLVYVIGSAASQKVFWMTV